MRRAGLGTFSAVCRAAGASPSATRTDPGAVGGAKRHVLLELQWQGRGGRFRHVVLSPPGLRLVLGTLGIVALFACAVLGAFSVRTNRALVRSEVEVDTVLRENRELRARQEALRERAFELAERLYWRVEHGRRVVWMADTPGHSWGGRCPRPPARDAGDEAILAWLSEQGRRLEAIGNELEADPAEMGLKRASARVPVNGGWATVRGESALYVAELGSASGQETVAAKR